MALSNWDTCAIDQNNQSIDGTIVSTSKPDYSVAIYKNWAYLYFQNNIVGTIQFGEIAFGPFSIHAERGPDNGIYILVEETIYEPDKQQAFILLGCGIYGYGYDIEDTSDPMYALVQIHQDGEEEEIFYFNGEDDFFISPEAKQNAIELSKDHANPVVDIKAVLVGSAVWYGVRQHNIDFLVNMYTKYVGDYPPAGFKPDFSQAVRFNQGDAYFADRIGFEVPATAIGKAESTILSNLISNISPQENTES